MATCYGIWVMDIKQKRLAPIGKPRGRISDVKRTFFSSFKLDGNFEK